METCVLDSTASCQSAVTAAEKYTSNTLPGLLDKTLSAIHSHAPSAEVVVLGYPVFYDLTAKICIGLSGADHQALDAGINNLDGVLKAAAARNGAVFADVRSTFTGHQLCSGSAWLNAVTLPIDNSYHPNASGQQGGYLPALTAASVG
jgi:hypothetical protein